ncbi:MAG: hypothetical protein R2831_08305 [Chitinophagaceae bacterium]
MKAYFSIILLFVTTTFLFSCTKVDVPANTPSCIKKQIIKIAKHKVYNPPAKVYRLTYKDYTYYYISSDCCDQYSFICDKDCNTICAPDGGLTGQGDGNCPSFIDSMQSTLIWEDHR